MGDQDEDKGFQRSEKSRSAFQKAQALFQQMDHLTARPAMPAGPPMTAPAHLPPPLPSTKSKSLLDLDALEVDAFLASQFAEVGLSTPLIGPPTGASLEPMATPAPKVEIARPHLPPRPASMATKESALPSLPPRPAMSSTPSLSSKIEPLKPSNDEQRASMLTRASSVNSTMGKVNPLLQRPDFTHANRRSPRTRGYDDIQLKAAPRCCLLTPHHLVTGGQHFRIFDLATGQNVFTMPLTSDSMINAMCLGPELDRRQEGGVIWAGMSDGQLLSIAIPSGEVVDKRTSAHLCAVTHTLRCRLDIWSVDENGTLCLWKPESKDSNQLSHRPVSFRVAAKTVAAMIVQRQALWTASVGGKVIEVFDPASGTGSKRLDVGKDASAVTCLAHTIEDGHLAYSGHEDGKVIVWHTGTLTKLNVLDVGVYRITSMHCNGTNHLWVGMSMGKIYILQAASLEGRGTAVIKDWKAHNGPVVGLAREAGAGAGYDRDAVPKFISWSDGGQIILWDGIAVADWIETELLQLEAAYTTSTPIRLSIASWNVDSAKPEDIAEAKETVHLKEWLALSRSSTMVICGLQEVVDLESKKTMGKSIFKKASSQTSPEAKQEARYQAWQEAILQILNADADGVPSRRFRLLLRQSMVGLFVCCFVLEQWAHRVTAAHSDRVKTGMGGLHGNKGAIAVRLMIDATSFCFLNCHLAAGQANTPQRNTDAATIIKDAKFPPAPHLMAGSMMNGGDGAFVLDHEYVFFFGDLNYRIELPRETILNHIAQGDWSALWDADQLYTQQQRQRTGGRGVSHSALRGFVEAGPLHFAPTYKYDPGTEQYDTSEKLRSPAWCDRILYRPSPLAAVRFDQTSDAESGANADGLSPRISTLFYGRHDRPMTSDHRPISGTFLCAVKTIHEAKLSDVQQTVAEGWRQFKYQRAQKELSLIQNS